MPETLEIYYAQRAAEYERIYDKPERQEDLARLRAELPHLFRGHEVLEVACGTGYWTKLVAGEALSVTGIDVNPQVLGIAAAKHYPRGNVLFREIDIYRLETLESKHDAGLAAFWWSHLPRSRIGEFLTTFHAALKPGARVVLLDNRYVAGSSTPLSRRDEDGNTYQRRTLEDGRRFEVLKNFPNEDELRRSLKHFVGEIRYVALPHYWYALYETP